MFCRLQIACWLLVVLVTMSKQVAVDCKMIVAANSLVSDTRLLTISGGASGYVGAKLFKKQKKPSFFGMIKLFFITIIDPTYKGTLSNRNKDNASSKSKKINSKAQKLGSSPFGGVGGITGGFGGGGASFGPVCGPNGCC